ncbi:MAG: hypothetical protein QM765_49045 [Myxococcales bacterium]
MRTLALTGSALLFVSLVLTSAPARAQVDDEVFAKKPYVWKLDEKDQRLVNTKLFKAIAAENGLKNPHCARVAASLLAAFAEATPFFHKKDNRFALFKVFTDPMTTDKFPADDYLVHMLHRAMFDGKAPEAWLEAAKMLKAKYKAPIDLGKLSYAVDGPTPIDSIDFGLAVFLDRYKTEVLLSPTVALASALERFQDRYLDRDLAWGGLVLADIHKEDKPPPPKLKKGQKPPPPPPPSDDEEEEQWPKYFASLLVPQFTPYQNPMFPTKQPEPMRVIVQMSAEQYLDVKKVVVSRPYLVHGRFYGFKTGDVKKDEPPMTIDIRNGLLFEEHDWTNYAGFANAEDVEACEIAINDLSPLGLKDHTGVGDRDAFAH